MIRDILQLIKTQANNAISNNPDIPAEKKDLAVNTTTDALKNGLKTFLTPGNISSIAGLLTSGTNTGNSGSNTIIQSLKNMVVNALSNKAGIQTNTANGVAASLIPNLINSLSGKINDPNNKKFDLSSIVSAFTGGNSGNQNSNVLQSLGGLLGK